MFFTVTTSRLFTLLYLCVSMLTASGSPLPPPDRVKPFGPEVSAGFRPQSKLQVGYCVRQLAQSSMPVGHMVLAIDDVIVEAVWADKPACTRLGPRKIPLKPDSSTYDWFTLGNAKFDSKELAFEALLSIKMPLFKETGGKCMDYVESALKTLAERKELLRPASVMEKFEERKKIFVTLMTGQQK